MKIKNLSAILDVFALNKPWFYLVIFCLAIMWMFVLLGNPLLPISPLAQYGWAWHHIPEFFTFLFLGMWFGDFKVLSSKRINLTDIPFLILLTIMSLIETVSFTPIVVIPIVTIPSFMGYFIKRLHTIKMSENYGPSIIKNC